MQHRCLHWSQDTALLEGEASDKKNISFMIYIFGEKKVIFIEIGKSDPIGPPRRRICHLSP